MENIIINDSNINEKQAELLSSSVRAVLYYNDNVLVEKSFDGSILLPGSVFRCPAKELLIKDLSLKLGYEVNESELTKFLFLNHFYDGMITRGNLASTDYFYGKFRGIDYTKSLKSNNYLPT